MSSIVKTWMKSLPAAVQAGVGHALGAPVALTANASVLAEYALAHVERATARGGP